MTALPLLALAGYFLILFELIAMRHRDICAESDARIVLKFQYERGDAFDLGDIDAWEDKCLAQALYWSRGTK